MKTRPAHLPVATLGAANLPGHGGLNTTNNSATSALSQLSAAAGPNASGAIAGLVVGTIGEAILLGQGLFSSGAFSAPDGGGGSAGDGGDFADATDDGSDGSDDGGSAAAFDSGAVYLPNDAQADPNGSAGGVLLSATSNTDGGNAGMLAGAFDQQMDTSAAQVAESGGTDVSPTIYDAPNTKIDAVSQAGRYLNVVNLSAVPATLFVQYHAQDQNGAWNWFPAAPDMSWNVISFDLKPGQAVELWDGDWHVYADKARVWAASTDGKQQWNRYKDTDLLLVSERDDQGQPCYFSPDIQTLSFGLK